MSREYTTEEVRQEFLDHIRATVRSWASLDHQTCEEKLDGVAFGFLCMLDGVVGELPAFVTAPSPHPDDKDYRIEEGEDYYPENRSEQVKADISGGLHEQYGSAWKDVRA